MDEDLGFLVYVKATKATGSSIKKLADSSADFGVRNAECIECSKLKAPASAEAPAGRQSSKKIVAVD